MIEFGTALDDLNLLNRTNSEVLPSITDTIPQVNVNHSRA